MDKENEMEYYSTRDIQLAATLMTIGVDVVTVDFQLEGDRSRPIGYFSFEDNKEVRKAETDYLRGAIKVEPKQLFNNLKALKGLVNNIYKNPRSKF